MKKLLIFLMLGVLITGCNPSNLWGRDRTMVEYCQIQGYDTYEATQGLIRDVDSQLRFNCVRAVGELPNSTIERSNEIFFIKAEEWLDENCVANVLDSELKHCNKKTLSESYTETMNTRRAEDKYNA